MLQLSNTYTFELADGTRIVFGPDRTAADWCGWVTGLDTDAEVEKSIEKLAGVNGALQGRQTLGARSIVLEATLVDHNPARRAERLERIDLLSTIHDPAEPATLRWQEANGPVKEITCWTTQTVDVKADSEGPKKTIQVYMQAPDPFVYSAEEHTVEAIAPGASAYLLNAGNALSFPRLWAYGPFEGVELRNTRTSEALYVAQPVADGEFLLIDCHPLETSVRLNGQASVYDKVEFNADTFFGVPRGGAEVEFRPAGATGAATKLRVQLRSAWVR